MKPVADQLREDSVHFRCGPDYTRIAVMNRGHGVVQVRQMAGACLINGMGIVIIGIRMRNGNGTELPGLPGKGNCPVELRREIHDPDQPAAAIVQLPECFKIRAAQVASILCAFFLF